MINKENLKTVKELNEEIQKIDEQAKEIRRQADEEVKQLKEEVSYKDLEEQLKLEKQKIESEARQEYTITKEKKLLGGVGIREISTIEYDKEKAFKWAKEHNLCLELDTKAFEKIAKNQDINFVKKEKEIKVTWPKEIKLED